MVKAAQVVFVRLTPNFFLVLPTPIHTIYLENEVIVECLERSGLMDHPSVDSLIRKIDPMVIMLHVLF